MGMKIEAKKFSGYEYFNITGGRLKTKFSIQEAPQDLIAVAAKGNIELCDFLTKLLGDPDVYGRDEWLLRGYRVWVVDYSKVVATINAVIREFE